MRAIGPRPRRLTPEELQEPVATLKGVSRTVIEATLDHYEMVYQGPAMLAEGQLPSEIYKGPGRIGYVAATPGEADRWTMLILPHQTPDAPEPPPRSRAVRLH
jgi:hypothetical protein